MLQDPLMDIFLDFGCLNHEAHPGILVAETIFILKPHWNPRKSPSCVIFWRVQPPGFLGNQPNFAQKKHQSQSSNSGCMVFGKGTKSWSNPPVVRNRAMKLARRSPCSLNQIRWVWNMRNPREKTRFTEYVYIYIIYELVVYLPLWKIWKSVGIILPNIWKNKKCSKPPTSIYIYIHVNVDQDW